MLCFDVSKEWVIHIPRGMPVAKQVAEDISHYLEVLRNQAGLSLKPPGIKDSPTNSPDYLAPQIRLCIEGNSREQTGFFWRIEKDRIEISGESDRGLCNGVFDFLGALGFRWPEPGKEILPPVNTVKPQEYIPQERARYHPSTEDTIRRRLFFQRRHPTAAWKPLIIWAVRNQIDILVFSLYVRVLSGRKKEAPSHPWIRFGRKMLWHGRYSRREAVFNLAEQYALTIERGGWDLSLLVPRWYFGLNREIFRMDSGKRDWKYNFCPTAPDTIKLIRREAEKLFRTYPETLVYHLWPDRNHERAWCACPTCRAFSLDEQVRIAVTVAADVLMQINPRGLISYYERFSGNRGIALRPNLLKMSRLPGEAGAEAEGWFSETSFKGNETAPLKRS
jgi:hypothetical protein